MVRKEKLEELKSIVEELKMVEMIEKEVSPSKRFLQSVAYNIKLNNGIIIPREKLVKGGKDGSAAIIVPQCLDGEFITVIEPRVFTKHTVGVGFPAGYIEKGEDIETGALRELREETGYVPENIKLLDSYYQDEGCSEAYNHIFLAQNCIKKYNQSLDENEIVKYIKFNYDELLELERMSYISGSNSKLALAKIKQYIK